MSKLKYQLLESRGRSLRVQFICIESVAVDTSTLRGFFQCLSQLNGNACAFLNNMEEVVTKLLFALHLYFTILKYDKIGVSSLKRFGLFLSLAVLLTGCSQTQYTSVNPHEQFVATVNIVEPSVQFYSNSCEPIASWVFEEPYTGGVLVGFDQLLLYGNQMTEAHLYELSSGRLIKKLEVAVGTTNAYFDVESEQFFMTNSKTNELTMYSQSGEKLKKLRLKNYPMSMMAADGLLYVINYKDTVLSVVDIAQFQVVDEWKIPKDSHGLLVRQDTQELWVGGHGVGSTPNTNVLVLNLGTGDLKEKLQLPMMPVDFAQSSSADEVAVISHGNSSLYILDQVKDIKATLQIGANPFAVAYLDKQFAVAGYDDDTLYFVKDGQVVKECETFAGPFQLLVRES